MTQKTPEENIEDIKQMSIHEKLMNMKFDLMDCDMKKSGHNDFSDYDYYELQDILPPVKQLCKKYRCLTHVDFPGEQKAILTLINVDNPDDVISTSLRQPELRELKRMNLMQSEGAYETYSRRYLYINLFDITESDPIEGLANEQANKPAQKSTPAPQQKAKTNTAAAAGKKQAPKKDVPKPASLTKVVKKCKEEYPDKECTKGLLNRVRMKMMQNKEITKKENKEIYDYLQGM